MSSSVPTLLLFQENFRYQSTNSGSTPYAVDLISISQKLKTSKGERTEISLCLGVRTALKELFYMVFVFTSIAVIYSKIIHNTSESQEASKGSFYGCNA